MKLGIVGSRSVSFDQAKPFILSAIKKYQPTQIVSGGAKGVDSHAEKIANELGIPVVVYRPKWCLGRHAGFLRNTTIVENSDHIVCIFSGSSILGGTKDTYKKAKKFGVSVSTYFVGGSQLPLF